MFARSMVDPDQSPTPAQIIPIRRCNLACTYCNEFDKTSPPVPTDEMIGEWTSWRTWERQSSRSAGASQPCTRIWIC